MERLCRAKKQHETFRASRGSSLSPRRWRSRRARGEPARAGAPVAIAVMDFDYADSSGEARDQTREHQQRTLELPGACAPISPPIPPIGWSRWNARRRPRGARADEVVAAAKRAGAQLILYGGVHKMSSLVQWAAWGLVDVEADKLLDDRFLTFRGDFDEAWRRAEAFVVEKMKGRSFER